MIVHRENFSYAVCGIRGFCGVYSSYSNINSSLSIQFRIEYLLNFFVNDTITIYFQNVENLKFELTASY